MSHSYYYRDTTTRDDMRDVRARIEALEIECDGVGENDCAELQRLRAQLAELVAAAQAVRS